MGIQQATGRSENVALCVFLGVADDLAKHGVCVAQKPESPGSRLQGVAKPGVWPSEWMRTKHAAKKFVVRSGGRDGLASTTLGAAERHGPGAGNRGWGRLR